MAPEEIQGIAGDKDTSKTLSGSTSKWFKVKIAEDSGLLKDIRFKATLTYKGGADFDLFLYKGDKDGVNCLGNAILATGNPESVGDSWGDTALSDDSRWMLLEVRLATGTPCLPGGSWSLLVEGNTAP